jgi:hypothetical protein
MSALNENAVTLLATLAGVDATAVAITEIYVVPPGKDLIVDHIKIHVTSFTDGGKGVQAVASFGGNAATYDDYLNTVTYTISAADMVIRDSVEDTEYIIQAAGDSFRISVEVASDATVEVWTVYLFGHLVDA